MNLVDKLSEMLVERETGCWEFIGGRTGSGYGAISIGSGASESAHVISYKLSKGPVPKGMCVCHTCDNKICCNPDHLFLGSHKDNKADEIAKGRHVRGERQGSSKLKEDDIRRIRVLISQGFSLNHIGRMYNVTGEAIGLIKFGVNWGWLQ